jgi:hypothetical protein
MQAMLVKPALFDVFLLLISVGYLFVLYIFLSGWQNTVDSMRSAWEQRPSVGFGSSTTKNPSKSSSKSKRQ